MIEEFQQDPAVIDQIERDPVLIDEIFSGILLLI